jgi:hypothetical protein
MARVVKAHAPANLIFFRGDSNKNLLCTIRCTITKGRQQQSATPRPNLAFSLL